MGNTILRIARSCAAIGLPGAYADDVKGRVRSGSELAGTEGENGWHVLHFCHQITAQMNPG